MKRLNANIITGIIVDVSGKRPHAITEGRNLLIENAAQMLEEMEKKENANKD